MRSCFCFSLHAKDKSTVIAVGIGIPAYKARPAKVLPGFPEKSERERLKVSSLAKPRKVGAGGGIQHEFTGTYKQL